MQSRDDKTARNVSVIGEQRGVVYARAAGSRRAGEKPGTPSSAPIQLRPLDRSIEPAKESAPGTSDHGRDKERKGQGDAKPQAAEKQQAERQRQAECERQAIQQHQDVSQCLSETPPQEHTNSPNGGNSNRDNNRK